MRKGILKLIRDAIQAGELADCDADRLARVVQATLNGSLLQWAIERQGELASWLRGNLAAVLGPLVRRPVRRAQR